MRGSIPVCKIRPNLCNGGHSSSPYSACRGRSFSHADLQAKSKFLSLLLHTYLSLMSTSPSKGGRWTWVFESWHLTRSNQRRVIVHAWKSFEPGRSSDSDSERCPSLYRTMNSFTSNNTHRGICFPHALFMGSVSDWCSGLRNAGTGSCAIVFFQ